MVNSLQNGLLLDLAWQDLRPSAALSSRGQINIGHLQVSNQACHMLLDTLPVQEAIKYCVYVFLYCHIAAPLTEHPFQILPKAYSTACRAYISVVS